MTHTPLRACLLCSAAVRISEQQLQDTQVDDAKAVWYAQRRRYHDLLQNLQHVLFTGSRWSRPILTHPSVYGEPLINYLAEIVCQKRPYSRRAHNDTTIRFIVIVIYTTHTNYIPTTRAVATIIVESDASSVRRPPDYRTPALVAD